MAFKEKLSYFWLLLKFHYCSFSLNLSKYSYKNIKLRFERKLTTYLIRLVKPYFMACLRYSLYDGLNERLKLLEKANDNKKEYFCITFETTITNSFFEHYDFKGTILNKDKLLNVFKKCYAIKGKVEFEIYDSPVSLKFFIAVSKDCHCAFRSFLYLLGAIRITDRKLVKYIQENYEKKI